MDRTEQMRAFLIKFAFYALWIVIIYLVLQYAMPFIGPFLVAFLIAFMLKPLINLVARKTPLGRRAAAVILLILLYAVVGTGLTFLGIKLVVSLGNWLADLPSLYKNSIEPVISDIGDNFDGIFAALDPSIQSFMDTASASISSAVSNIVSAVSSGAINLVTSFAGRVPWVVVGVVLCIIASFFFVVDYYKITSFVVRQLPPRGRRLLFVIKDFVVNVLGRFARAYLILMSLTFVEVSIGLLILRVPNPFLIAFITAIVDILPVFGTGTIMIPWALICLFTGDIFLGVGLLVLYLAITLIRQFLEPRVVGGQIGLYPLLTLITMFIGARLFGFWGLFGFPVTLTVLIHLNRSGEIKLFREAAPAATDAPPGATGPKNNNAGGE